MTKIGECLGVDKTKQAFFFTYFLQNTGIETHNKILKYFTPGGFIGKNIFCHVPKYPSVSIGGHSSCILRFADDIDLIAGNRRELHDRTLRLEKAAGAFGMEVSAEKSKFMVSRSPGQHPSIKMNNTVWRKSAPVNHHLQVPWFHHVTWWKITYWYQEQNCCLIKSCSLVEQQTNQLWSEIQVVQHSCSVCAFVWMWKLDPGIAESEHCLQAFEMKCIRRVLGISYKEHKTNELVRQLTLTPLNLTKHYCSKCKNVKVRLRHWYRAYTLTESLAKQRHRHGLAWVTRDTLAPQRSHRKAMGVWSYRIRHGWSMDWCARGPGINSGGGGEFYGVNFKWDWLYM